MLKPRALTFFCIILLCHVSFSQTGKTGRYIPGKTPVGFESEINNFIRQDSICFPAEGACLFTGSSTIRMWDSLSSDFREIPVIQRGFGGSTMKALNFYIRDIVIPYKPRVIVVYEGDNDLLLGVRPAEFIAHCDTFISIVHKQLPKTMIYFISVKPSFARMQHLVVQQETNRQLKQLAKRRPKTKFIDLSRVMYDHDGRLRKDYFISDSLHLSRACYKAWAAQMKSKTSIIKLVNRDKTGSRK